MAPEPLLSELEHLVLLAVLRLGENAYAVPVRHEISSVTGLQPLRGSIYVTLDRLEKKDYLVSEMGDPTPERGGKARRYFRVTPAARRALRASRAAFHKMWEGVETTAGKP
ncbi:MAG: PadR family transcriptional regulator [Candidatus Acidiferrales bacterium]